MEDFDLLSAVQPDTGWFVILGIDGEQRRQKIVATREEADEEIARLAGRNYNVFFAVAKFASDANRTKQNVQSLKSFWLDLDCGESKAELDPKTGRPDGYATQEDALEALENFIEHTGLPNPVLVNSGRGVHAYWPLEEEIPRHEWEHVAARLRDVCHTNDLYVDKAVFEVARVMRVPGTFNQKDGAPKPVSVIRPAEAVALEEFKDILGVKGEALAPRERKPLTALGQALAANTGYNFNRIMSRSLKGDGCNQLAHAYNNRANLGYMEWWYALTVAASCDNGSDMAHKLSKGHEGYDPAVVDAKVISVEGPTSCAKFQANNPELCEGCPHMGKIVGPRELGKQFKPASTEDNTVETEDDVGIKTTLTIPDFPWPFERGKNGGIYREEKDSEGEVKHKLVYKNDFYVVKCMRDGPMFVVVFRLHLPKEGVEEFTLPMAKAMDKTELRKAITSHGVVISAGKQLDELLWFIQASIEDWQEREKAEKMRQQFGWADNDTRFIIGSREHSAAGSVYSPPSEVTAQLASFMQPKGTLDGWKEVWELYGDPALAPNAFAALSAFGAPLLRLQNQVPGAAINLHSEASGTGKTTVLNMINSVYGHPSELRLKESDTYAAKLQWLGVLNSLPCTMDEITNMKGEEFSNLVYAMANGKGRERMEGASNTLRTNNTKWQTITVCSSNASFVDKLKGQTKNNPQGELMRFIEYPIYATPVYDTNFAERMFDNQLFDNYGLAGPVYMNYVLRHKEWIAKELEATRLKFKAEIGLSQGERFWSNTVAANLTALIVCKEVGLLRWTSKPIYEFICNRIYDLSKEVETPKDGADQVLGEFLYSHAQNILVIDGANDKRTNMAALPQREPKGELVVRIEPDTKRMYIITKALRAYCANNQINYSELTKTLKAEGKLLGSKSMQLGKGTNIGGLNAYCTEINLEVPGFINADAYAESEDVGG